MSKAEDRALKSYPVNVAQREGYDENLRERKGFIKGYHQAEKDLELSWEDVAVINNIITEMLNDCGDNILYDTEKDFCQEVLKRFKLIK